jgi:cytosine/adenosine deaminase-related metal-dependent hydrolase
MTRSCAETRCSPLTQSLPPIGTSHDQLSHHTHLMHFVSASYRDRHYRVDAGLFVNIASLYDSYIRELEERR